MVQNLQFGYQKNSNLITIGIIDDNQEQRDSFKDAIENYLKKENREGIEVLDIEPLQNKESYANWIREHEVVALIIDEKLADVPISATGKSCGYEGHDMAEELRNRKNIIPIHVVTSADINDDLTNNRELFENVLSRDDFRENRDKYAEIILRSGQRYFEENKKLYDQFAELSRKLVIDDKISEEDIKELRSLQEYFQVPLYTEEMVRRDDLISEFKKDLEELEKLNNEAKEFLDKQSKK